MDMDKDTFLQEQCHAYFDGAMTEEEQARFLQLVNTDPALCEVFEKLQKVNTALHEHSEVEPPPGLEDRVIQAMEYSDKTGSREHLTSLASRRNRPLFAMRIAATVLLVACVGILATQQPWQKQAAEPKLASDDSQATTVAQQSIESPATQTGTVGGTETEENRPLVAQDPVQNPVIVDYDDLMLEQSLETLWYDVAYMETDIAYMDDTTDWVTTPFF